MTDRITIFPANLLIVAVALAAYLIAVPVAVYHADRSVATVKEE